MVMELGGVPRFGPGDLDLQPARERAEGVRELAGRRAGEGGQRAGKGRARAGESSEPACGSGVEGAWGSEGGGDGREGEGSPDPWKRWTTPQCARGLVSSASVEV